MKKALVILGPVLCIVIVLCISKVFAVGTYLYQTHSQFYNDDSLNSATAIGAQDANLTAWNSYQRIRLRLQSESTGNTSGTSTFQYNVDGGSFANVPTTLTGNGLLAVSDSPFFTNGSLTTQRLSTPTLPANGTVFVTGNALDTGVQTFTELLSTYYYTENEICLTFSYLARKHTFGFRIYSAIGNNSYTYNTPYITIKADNNVATGM